MSKLQWGVVVLWVVALIIYIGIDEAWSVSYNRGLFFGTVLGIVSIKFIWSKHGRD